MGNRSHRYADQWNERHPVGTLVRIAGTGKEGRTTAPAISIWGSPAVVMISENIGSVALSSVEVIGPPPQYSAATCDTWCEPCDSEEGAIDEAVHYWWCSYAEEGDSEIEVEVGEAVECHLADHLMSGLDLIHDALDRAYHHAPEDYDPLPRDHRDARGLPCINPAIAKSIEEGLEPALREVLRTWWAKHGLPTWFEVPRSRTVKVRVRVDEHGDLAGWEVER